MMNKHESICQFFIQHISQLQVSGLSLNQLLFKVGNLFSHILNDPLLLRVVLQSLDLVGKHLIFVDKFIVLPLQMHYNFMTFNLIFLTSTLVVGKRTFLDNFILMKQGFNLIFHLYVLVLFVEELLAKQLILLFQFEDHVVLLFLSGVEARRYA